VAFVGAQLAHEFGGGLVGDAEAGAERVTGDGLPVLVLMLRGGTAGRREQGLVLRVLNWGRPSRRRQVTGTAVPAGDRPGSADGAALDHGDRDQESAGRDGGHDPAPDVRLGLGRAMLSSACSLSW
jgi:hypothetical protein